MKGTTHIRYTVILRSNFRSRLVANEVILHIPVPSDVDTPSFRHFIGHVEYCPEEDIIKWKINQLIGQKEHILRATFGLPTVQTQIDPCKLCRPIRVFFEIPYYNISGLQVRYVKVIEPSRYSALPWVRYASRNGNYEIRL